MSVVLQTWDNSYNFYASTLQVLSNKKTKHWKDTARFSAFYIPLSTPRPRKVIGNLNVTCKNIYPKKKANEILPAPIGKIKSCLFKKTGSCFFRL